jgi:hypothetical protein
MHITVRDLFSAGLWEEYCLLHGWDSYCCGEGKIRENEEVELTEEDIRYFIGFLLKEPLPDPNPYAGPHAGDFQR